MQNPSASIIALDVGAQRIGVARASSFARLASPLTTLQNTDTIMQDIVTLLDDEQAAAIVVGRPRGMQGQETAQTRTIFAFADGLKKLLDIPLFMQDEAVTSHKAEEELKKRGKPYAKGDIDALAATYILEDFLREHPEDLS